MIAKDEDLTAEELAYLNSGGQTEVPAADPQPEPEAQDGVSAEANTETQPATVADDEEDADALPNGIRVITDDQGRQRLVNAEGKYVRSVPHAALHKERERRKAVEAEYAKSRETQARLDERLAILNEAMKPKPEPKGPANPLEEADISAEEDPLGALAQLQRRNQFLIQERSRSADESRHQSEARTVFENVQNTYKADAARMIAENPSFKDAYAFLMKGRDAEYQALGMTDPAQRAAAIAKDEAEIVIGALKGGRSPAETIYAIATARGFAPTAAAPADGTMKPTASSTQATAKLQQIRNGQAAAATLSGTGGTPSEGLTAESLASMSQADFDAMVDKLTPQQQRQLFGG